MLPLIQNMVPVPLKEKQLQTLIFSPPCFTVLMTNLGSYSLFFGLLTYFLVLGLPKRTTLNTFILRILRHFHLGKSTWSLANLNRLRTCRVFSNGIFLGLQPHKMTLIRRRRIVEVCMSCFIFVEVTNGSDDTMINFLILLLYFTQLYITKKKKPKK